MSGQKERIYYLDSMRGVLILLVVVMHGAQVYNPAHTWLIYSENSSLIGGYIVNATSFRMPAFFIIAGYFTVVSFRHSHTDGFLFHRIKRLLIPLIVVALTLNSLQAYLLNSTGWKSYTLIPYLQEGQWIQHLWFLINLIAYTIISFLIVKSCKASVKKVMIKVVKVMTAFPMYVILFLLPLVSIILLAGFKLIPTFILGVNIAQILWYTPFFLFGVLLMLNKDMLIRFSNISPVLSIIVIISAHSMHLYFQDSDILVYKIINKYFEVLGIWFSSSLIFYIFKKFANKRSTFFYNLSDASYTIYVVHHILVIAMGLLLIKINTYPTLGMLILIVSASLLSYSVHRLIVLKISIFQLLLNGYRKKKAL